MQMEDEELLERLKAHPEIRERLEGTLRAVPDEEGELGEADTAELRLIEEMRQMGRASLSAWAQRKAERETAHWQERAGVCREGKKLCWHTSFGDIGLEEVQLREGTRRVRPFVPGAKVYHRGVSRALQRAVTDFAADIPFARAMDK